MSNPSVTGTLPSLLTSAHARLEKSFLEGGAALVSVTEIINSLMEIMNRLTGFFDGQTSRKTIDGLRRTVCDLALLPSLAETRQTSFKQITDLCDSARDHVADMREIIRYLGTFAITVKITGAGLAEFSGFAEEIRERIQSGASEIGRFAEQLNGMHQQLDTARTFADGVLTEFQDTIPAIVASLEASSANLTREHQAMAAVAQEVKSIASGIQGKVATVLSALQIGDITRQRLEHVQSSLEFLDEHLAASGSFSNGDAERVKQAILHLAHAQLTDTLADFRQKCAAIFQTISSFTTDAARILALRDEMKEEDESLLHKMQADIRRACGLSQRVQERSQESDGLVSSVTQTAQQLLEGIETIRAIKTDIHYMALNSNLRCSRLGDAGRSVNVVSGELRTFAAKLETPADAIVEDMRKVEQATMTLTTDEAGDIDHIHEPLQCALDALETVSTQMDEGLGEFSAQGQQVFSRINAAVSKLDFKDQLADMLQSCLDRLEPQLAERPATHDLEPLMGHLSQRIFAIYTMAQERALHQQLLPFAKTSEPAPSTATAQDDDELLAAALF
ncbi:chemotaxis protein [Allorhizobium undicola]|uniref:chemotaxis protein n=1 Tax=Allorhizobium undicola TaxID=78527 RepID=UPI000687BB5A|nr:chemotaxis protein [Allorhizobium undicola]